MKVVNKFSEVLSSKSIVRSTDDIYKDCFKEIQALREDISAMVADRWSSKVKKRILRSYSSLDRCLT